MYSHSQSFSRPTDMSGRYYNAAALYVNDFAMDMCWRDERSIGRCTVVQSKSSIFLGRSWINIFANVHLSVPQYGHRRVDGHRLGWVNQIATRVWNDRQFEPEINFTSDLESFDVKTVLYDVVLTRQF